jgi:AraC family transcriptional regulator, regulatory protein of adaptative response / methylphosphotriester-DNA alkyltransferase methyltransferase
VQAYALIQLAYRAVYDVMVTEAKRPATVERRRALFEDAAEIVRCEYPRPLALDDVARRVAASRRQLQRAFAEAGETTFRTYLQKVRMAQAAQLLRQDSMPVNRVARAVGYRQPAQFAKAFRRHHGAPPSAFRDSAG